MIPAVCPNCQRNLKVPPAKSGSTLTCPACKAQFRLNMTAAALPAQPLPPARSERPSREADPILELDFDFQPPPVPQSKAKPRPVPLPQPAVAPRPQVQPRALPAPMPTPMSELETVLRASGTAPQLQPVARPMPPPPIVRPVSAPSRRPRDDDEEPVASKPKGLVKVGFVVVGGLFLVMLCAGIALGTYYLTKGDSTKATPTAAPAPPAKSLGKYGGIEIGSKGVKAVAVEFFAAEEGHEFDLPYEKTINPGLAVIPPGTSDFDPKALDDTVAAVKNYFRILRDEHGLAPERISVVASSGLFTPFDGDAEALERNRSRLADGILQATGKTLDRVDSFDEARHSVMACVPVKDRAETLLIDIGGGNTKGGYFESTDNFTTMGLKFGTTTFAAEATKNAAKPPGQRKTPDQLRESVLAGPLRQEITRKPGLKNTRKVYLMGGLVWGMTAFTHPEELAKTRLTLKVEDIDAFKQLLAKPDQDRVRRDIVAGIPQSDEPGKEFAKKVDEEHQKVQKTYNQQQLQSGIHILQALAGEYDFRSKELVFFRKGQFAWLVGYLVEINGIDKAAAAK